MINGLYLCFSSLPATQSALTLDFITLIFTRWEELSNTAHSRSHSYRRNVGVKCLAQEHTDGLAGPAVAPTTLWLEKQLSTLSRRSGCEVISLAFTHRLWEKHPCWPRSSWINNRLHNRRNFTPNRNRIRLVFTRRVNGVCTWAQCCTVRKKKRAHTWGKVKVELLLH